MVVIVAIVVIVYISEYGFVMSLLREVWVRPKNDEMNLATSKLPASTNNTETGGDRLVDCPTHLLVIGCKTQTN